MSPLCVCVFVYERDFTDGIYIGDICKSTKSREQNQQKQHQIKHLHWNKWKTHLLATHFSFSPIWWRHVFSPVHGHLQLWRWRTEQSQADGSVAALSWQQGAPSSYRGDPAGWPSAAVNWRPPPPSCGCSRSPGEETRPGNLKGPVCHSCPDF